MTTRYLEIDEYIELTGNRYVNGHCEGGKWTQEEGFLERRLQAIPVHNDRRQTRTVGPQNATALRAL